LIEWWFAGFDGGSQLIIGVESLYASYILSEPHFNYKHLFVKSSQKMLLTKIIIESMLKNPESSYEDLVEDINDRNEEFSEELLLQLASFVVEQIKSFDDAAEEDEIRLYDTPAIQRLIYLSGISDSNRLKKTPKAISHIRPIARIDARRAANSDTLTTSTTLVRNIFDTLFKEVIENDSNHQKYINTSRNSFKNGSKALNSEHMKVNWIGNVVYEDKFARTTYYKSFKINEEIVSLFKILISMTEKLIFITIIFDV